VKIVPYDTLVPDIAGIQPNIAWLLANVPRSIPYTTSMVAAADRSCVMDVLEDLQLKFAKLQGKVLELEAHAFEAKTGDVYVILPEESTDDDDAAFVEEALRSTLAELIVNQGEKQLEKERLEKNRKYAKLYGGDFLKLVQGPGSQIRWRFTAEDVEHWKAMTHTLIQDPGGWSDSIQEAIRKSREEAEEAEALKAAKATAAAIDRRIREECSDCVPDIDLDGFYLD